ERPEFRQRQPTAHKSNSLAQRATSEGTTVEWWDWQRDARAPAAGPNTLPAQTPPQPNAIRPTLCLLRASSRNCFARTARLNRREITSRAIVPEPGAPLVR